MPARTVMIPARAHKLGACNLGHNYSDNTHRRASCLMMRGLLCLFGPTGVGGHGDHRVTWALGLIIFGVFAVVSIAIGRGCGKRTVRSTVLPFKLGSTAYRSCNYYGTRMIYYMILVQACPTTETHPYAGTGTTLHTWSRHGQVICRPRRRLTSRSFPPPPSRTPTHHRGKHGYSLGHE